MAHYTGYVTIPTGNYQIWRNSVLGNGYNADGFYGEQCWDLTAEFWYNVGFPQGYPQTGNGYAYGCWSLRRDVNKGNVFDLIYNKTDIRRGDVVVLNYGRFAGDDTGHIAFADEDYNGTDYLKMLGQNQENASPTQGYLTTVTNMGIAKFLGAFRYKPWETTPPSPTPTTRRGRFPWVLYANKLRNR